MTIGHLYRLPKPLFTSSLVLLVLSLKASSGRYFKKTMQNRLKAVSTVFKARTGITLVEFLRRVPDLSICSRMSKVHGSIKDQTSKE